MRLMNKAATAAMPMDAMAKPATTRPAMTRPAASGRLRATAAAFAGALSVSAMLLSAAVARAADISGVWITEEHEALIKVTPCGSGVCGSVAWLREPNDPDTGRPKTDTHNPDPARRSQPVVGSYVFYDMRPSSPDQWSGKIYSARDGITVDGQLISRGPNELRIQGCVIGICSGQNWTRQSAPAAAPVKRGKT